MVIWAGISGSAVIPRSISGVPSYSPKSHSSGGRPSSPYCRSLGHSSMTTSMLLIASWMAAGRPSSASATRVPGVVGLHRDTEEGVALPAGDDHVDPKLLKETPFGGRRVLDRQREGDHLSVPAAVVRRERRGAGGGGGRPPGPPG